MAQRRSHNYRQTVIGDCGHVCTEWPLVRRLSGGKIQYTVICDTCTAEEYRLNPDERVGIWVRVENPHDKDQLESAPAPRKKTAPKKTTKKIRCSLCGQGHIYTACPVTEGLFDVPT